MIPAHTQNGVDGEAIYDRALALKAGTPVGPKARFLTGHYISMVSADAAERCFGNWSNVKNRYLGLRFVIKQKTHFGWARLSVSCNSANNKIQALLTGTPTRQSRTSRSSPGRQSGRMTRAMPDERIQPSSTYQLLNRLRWVCWRWERLHYPPGGVRSWLQCCEPRLREDL